MSCRSRLATLNEKLTTLERRVEYIEARVSTDISKQFSSVPEKFFLMLMRIKLLDYFYLRLLLKRASIHVPHTISEYIKHTNHFLHIYLLHDISITGYKGRDTVLEIGS